MFIPPDPPLPDSDPCAGKISDLERTIAKIKAAVYRVGFNLWHIFQPLDEDRTNYISEAKFLSILLGPMKAIIGLETSEVGELAQYFKIDDGRIAYTRLCQQVHGKLSPPGHTDEERQIELMHSNKLGPREEKIITELLAKISVTVTPRKVVVMPFFQDYELVQKDSGLVSKNTFIRVLNFMGVPLSADELGLMIEKYRHDSGTIKYKAFLKELDEITDYLKEHDFVDLNGGLRDDYLGEVPHLPRIDNKPVPHGEHLGIQKVFGEQNPAWKTTAAETIVAFNKVKEHVHREQLRIEDFFNNYDKENYGRVPSEVFRAGINWIKISETSFNDLYLSGREVKLLLSVYQDPIYNEDSLWKVFQHDLEKDIDPEQLHKWPRRDLDRQSVDPLVVLYRPPTPPQEEPPVTMEEVFQHIIECMQTMDSAKRLLIILSQRDSDKSSYLTLPMFDWAFKECGIYLAPDELDLLRYRYEHPEGIHWRFFAEDLSSYQASLPPPSHHPAIDSGGDTSNIIPNTVGSHRVNLMNCDQDDRQKTELEDEMKVQNEKERLRSQIMESNVVEILAKIKNFAICKRIRMKDSLKVFDKEKKELITRTEFEKGLSQSGLSLSEKELDVLLDVFCLPTGPEMMEYTRFCRTVDEDSIPPCMVKPTLEEVISKNQQLETRKLPVHQWANFKQRKVVATAMEKLSKYVGLANTDLFKGLDKDNTGSISRSTFQTALLSLNCLHLLSNNELDTIIHCFGFKKGHFTELDYMSFLNGLDIVVNTKAAAKNL